MQLQFTNMCSVRLRVNCLICDSSTIFRNYCFLLTGHPKKLDEFTYEDSDINDIIMSCMSNVSFTGISGNIAFDQGSDPIKDVTIERIEGKTL